MKTVKVGDTLHQFPDDATDAEIAATLAGAQASSGGPPPAPDPRTLPARLYQDYIAAPLTKGVSYIARLDPELSDYDPPSKIPGEPQSPEEVLALAESRAKLVVPQHLSDALVTAALPALRPASVGGRLALGAGAKALGGLLEGKSVSDNAIDTAVTTGTLGVTEAALKAMPWLARSVSNNPIVGGKRNIEDAYTKRVADAIGDIIPEFRGAEKAADLVAAVKLPRGVKLPPGWSQQRSWDEALGEMMDVARANIRGQIQDAPLQLTTLPGRQPAGPVGTLLDAAGQPIQNVATQGVRATTLDDALGMLTALYQRGFSSKVLRPEVAGIEPAAAKQMAQDLKQEITSELIRLDPTQAARQLFQQSQNKYAMGTEIIRDVGKALRLGPTGATLNESALQQAVFDRLKSVGEKLGRQRVAEDVPGAALAKYLDAIYNQAQGFGRSALGAGTGDFGDSLRRAYGQGQGGTPAGLAAPIKAFLENAGARYFGQSAYSPPTNLAPILDAIANQMMEHARQRGVNVTVPVPLVPPPTGR